MVGAEFDSFAQLTPLFLTFATGRGSVSPTDGLRAGATAPEGFLYCGPVGADHFVKIIHNDIE